MSSTYLEVRTYKSKSSFQRRLNHNSRKTNISSGNYKDDDFINIIKVNNSNKKLMIKKQELLNETTRSDYANKISKLRYRMKFAKKPRTIEKLKVKIDDLESKRVLTKNLKKQASKSYVEFVLTITNVKKNLKRDIEYSEDISKHLTIFIKDRFPNLKVVQLATHLDQTNPHVHLNGFYNNYDSLTNDLKSRYENPKFQYEELQQDFNKYIQNLEALKKYDLKVESVVRGGKRDYEKLPKYKARQEAVLKKAKKQVNKYVNKVVREKGNLLSSGEIIKTLEDKILQLQVDKLTNNFKSKEFIESLEKLEKHEEEIKFLNHIISKKQSSVSNSLSTKDEEIQNLKTINNNNIVVLEKYQKAYKEKSLELEKYKNLKMVNNNSNHRNK